MPVWRVMDKGLHTGETCVICGVSLGMTSFIDSKNCGTIRFCAVRCVLIRLSVSDKLDYIMRELSLI